MQANVTLGFQDRCKSIGRHNNVFDEPEESLNMGKGRTITWYGQINARPEVKDAGRGLSNVD